MPARRRRDAGSTLPSGYGCVAVLYGVIAATLTIMPFAVLLYWYGAHPVAPPPPAWMRNWKRLSENSVEHREGVQLHSALEAGSVILYAKQNSGADVLGSFFATHPHVFYMFEPLNNLTLEGVIKQGAALLSELLSCSFSRLTHFSVQSPETDWLRRVFCSGENINPNASTVSQSRIKSCDDLDLTTAFCRIAKHKVANVAAVKQVKHLHPLMDSGHVRVILLVRDPRGVMTSRSGLAKSYGGGDSDDRHGPTYDVASLYCQTWLSDLAYIASLTEKSHSTAQYYHVVRYEDIVCEPRRHIEELYKFSGIELNNHVMDHVARVENNLTRSKTPCYQQSWQSHIAMDKAKAIQASCKKFMNIFHYRRVRTVEDLKQDTVDKFVSIPSLQVPS